MFKVRCQYHLAMAGTWKTATQECIASIFTINIVSYDRWRLISMQIVADPVEGR